MKSPCRFATTLGLRLTGASAAISPDPPVYRCILPETIGLWWIISTPDQQVKRFTPSGFRRRTDHLVIIHALLADGLLADPAMAGRLRRMPAGITHSSYRPLGDPFAIEEEFGILVHKATAITDPFEQSLFLLVHIPYLQAYDDVNKRTSRIASNVPLLKADLAPMSFLTMDDNAYIDALIGIYELNNVSLLREVYIDAYLTSAENYKTLRAEVEAPEKAALVYRDFVREAVRRSVLDWLSRKDSRRN